MTTPELVTTFALLLLAAVLLARFPILAVLFLCAVVVFGYEAVGRFLGVAFAGWVQ